MAVYYYVMIVLSVSVVIKSEDIVFSSLPSPPLFKDNAVIPFHHPEKEKINNIIINKGYPKLFHWTYTDGKLVLHDSSESGDAIKHRVNLKESRDGYVLEFSNLKPEDTGYYVIRMNGDKFAAKGSFLMVVPTENSFDSSDDRYKIPFYVCLGVMLIFFVLFITVLVLFLRQRRRKKRKVKKQTTPRSPLRGKIVGERAQHYDQLDKDAKESSTKKKSTEPQTDTHGRYPEQRPLAKTTQRTNGRSSPSAKKQLSYDDERASVAEVHTDPTSSESRQQVNEEVRPVVDDTTPLTASTDTVGHEGDEIDNEDQKHIDQSHEVEGNQDEVLGKGQIT